MTKILKWLYLPNEWLFSIMFTNINNLSLNSIHIIMMNLKYVWFYKAFISEKELLNNLKYFNILSCCLTSKTKRLMHFDHFDQS